MVEAVSLAEGFAGIAEHWRPKIAAELNGQEVKLVKAQGVFPWHHHADVDEMFLVWRGRLRLEFRDHSIELGQGEFAVVPKGVEHRPVAEHEVEMILFEPADVLNTGNIVDEAFTAPVGARL
jgi:mannose-6-phosphate isomerase-like protein (cupin superfamily)